MDALPLSFENVDLDCQLILNCIHCVKLKKHWSYLSLDLKIINFIRSKNYKIISLTPEKTSNKIANIINNTMYVCNK